MKNIRVIFFMISLAGCSTPTNKTAKSIIEKSIETHGGLDTWTQAQSLSYSKTTTLFDKEGNQEYSITQQHDYQLLPSFSASISWMQDSIEHLILFANDSVSKKVNGEYLTDQNELEKALNAVKAAQYVVSQPFKLMDEDIKLTYEGQQVLDDGILVDAVRAEYDKNNVQHTKSDRWWYYFDVNTARCIGNMVNHGDTYSYIKNLSYDSTSAILFNQHRKSYTVDKDRNIQFLRAEYFYNNYRLD